MPAATAPCSDSGSAASVIRAATLRRHQPVLGDRDEQQVEEEALVVGRLAAGEQQVEVLGEAQPPHQIAGEVAAAHLDAVGLGTADSRDGFARLADLHAPIPTCSPRPRQAWEVEPRSACELRLLQSGSTGEVAVGARTVPVCVGMFERVECVGPVHDELEGHARLLVQHDDEHDVTAGIPQERHVNPVAAAVVQLREASRW